MMDLRAGVRHDQERDMARYGVLDPHPHWELLDLGIVAAFMLLGGSWLWLLVLVAVVLLGRAIRRWSVGRRSKQTPEM